MEDVLKFLCSSQNKWTLIAIVGAEISINRDEFNYVFFRVHITYFPMEFCVSNDEYD